MTAPTTVFVTGATGFIGSRLVPRLLERGHTVRAWCGARNRLATSVPSGYTSCPATSPDQTV